VKKIGLALLVMMLIMACGVVATPVASTPSPGALPSLTPTIAPTAFLPAPTLTLPAGQAVLVRSSQVVAALQARDLSALAALVHPNSGLRLSPHAFVSVSDLTFMPAELPGLLENPTLYDWGVYDGSGLPITLTFEGYYTAFVYDQDYATAPQISLNQRLGVGNSLDNSREFYPGAMVVEYYFAGFDPQFGGMDWRSLRLVFQLAGGEWYLVGIIHDQWSI